MKKSAHFRMTRSLMKNTARRGRTSAASFHVTGDGHRAARLLAAPRRLMLALCGIGGWMLCAPQAGAHVKWFSDFSYSGKPNSPEDLFTPAFFWLAVLSMTVIGVMVLVEEWLGHKPWVRQIDGWLRSKQGSTEAILRLGMGAALLWDWQAGTLLAPELVFSSESILWMEFVCAFFLIFKKTVPLSGCLLFALYGAAISKFGLFHMLDYLMYPGIGAYFILNAVPVEAVRRMGLPLVYATVGFCLIWLGIEKLVYPEWAAMLLERHPVLALGFEHRFFVQGAAFVEMSLGFMIMACVQQRLLAVTITLVFFLTTLVFGRQEVVGHTVIHAVLIVFLIAGAGGAVPPLEWLRSAKLRVPAAALGFVVFFGTLLLPYLYGANIRYETSLLDAGSMTPNCHKHDKLRDVSAEGEAPGLAIAITRDPLAGWNLELVTENFEFSPRDASHAHTPGKGHAHLYIDHKKIARLYGNWYHIADLAPGPHEIRVTLNANDHTTLAVKERAVAAETKIEVVGEKLP